MIPPGTGELLGQVPVSFTASLAAYNAYLAGGKTYAHACILKQHNLKSKELLQQLLPLLPAPLRADAGALIAHYEAWLGCWNDLERKLNPGLSDVFVFENPQTFPREAAQRLEAACTRSRE